MASQWFYTQDEERMGPVSSEELKQLAESGELTADDLVWKEGMADWKPASQLKGLFEGAADSASASGPVMTGAVRTVQTPTPRPGTATRSGVWQIPLMISSLVLVTSMFLPWWTFRMKGTEDEFENVFSEEVEQGDGFANGEKKAGGNGVVRRRPGPSRKPDKEKLRQFQQNLSESLGWYLRNVHSVSVKSDSWDAFDGGKDEELEVEGTIWGWHASLGLAAAFIGLAILPVSVVMLAWKAARPFSWITSFFLAYVCLILGILTFMWWLDSPGFDVSPVFEQGAHIGPWIAITGSLLVLIFGVLDGIVGVIAFARDRTAE